jgi:hypothetical protein
MAGSSEHGNEPSSSIKGDEFLHQVTDFQTVRKDSALRRIPHCCKSVGSRQIQWTGRGWQGWQTQ